MEYKEQLAKEIAAANNTRHEVRYRNVNLNSGIKFMRVLGIMLYVLCGLAIILTFIVEYRSRYGGLMLMFICGGCLVPIAVGVVIRKIADIAEYLSEE